MTRTTESVSREIIRQPLKQYIDRKKTEQSGLLEGFVSWVLRLVGEWGGYGVFVGMVLESSVVPVPSEIILVTAGYAGISPLVVAVAGGLGSTVGAAVGYLIGKEGRVVVDRYGKYVLVTESRISKAEGWFRRWGNWTILASRLIPFVPYKVFSITGGLLKMNSRAFLGLTLLGSIPRCFLLAWLGSMIMQAEYEMLAGLILLVLLIAFGYHVAVRRSKRSSLARGLILH